MRKREHTPVCETEKKEVVLEYYMRKIANLFRRKKVEQAD